MEFIPAPECACPGPFQHHRRVYTIDGQVALVADYPNSGGYSPPEVVLHAMQAATRAGRPVQVVERCLQVPLPGDGPELAVSAGELGGDVERVGDGGPGHSAGA